MSRDRSSLGLRVTLVVLLAVAGACRRHPAGGSAASSAHTPTTPKLVVAQEAQALSNAFAAAAKAISASVVRVDVEGIKAETVTARAVPPDMPESLRKFFESQESPAPPNGLRGTGSGVIVDALGDVLTNGHVVRGARKVTLGLADQRRFSAHVIATDPLTDVGIVRFDKPPPGLVIARTGDSDKLRIGEWTIAVGSPLGMDQTVTVGIISGIGATGNRFRFESGERVRKYVQTDAKINPGNSGGPLVNLQGEIVGINTLINVGPGGSYGFAIPINQAWQVANTIIKEGHVRYPYIGISLTSLSDIPKNAPERAGANLPEDGALVGAVTVNGPAASAGLAPGDVVTKIAGKSVKTANDVVSTISDQHIGGSIAVEYSRDGNLHAARVKVKEYPAEPRPPTATSDARIGLALQTLTEAIASSLGLEPKTTGAIITEVTPASPAEAAGLAAGEIVREVDKRPVNTVDEAVAALRGGKGTRLLRITNAGGSRYVSVNPD